MTRRRAAGAHDTGGAAPSGAAPGGAAMAATGLLAKLQDQADNLQRMADDYLRDGLLGQHNEALEMRDRALETLADVRAKLGLPPEPQARAGADAAAELAEAAAAVPRAAPAPEAPEAEEAEEAEAPWSAPCDVPASALLPGASAADSLDAPRYRWRARRGGGAALEVLEAAGGEAALDVSAGAVRLTWGDRAATLPLGFVADESACAASRRRRRRLLTVEVPLLRELPDPTPALAEELSGADGHGLVDGFFAGAEADALRSQLLALWREGTFRAGEIEGGPAQRPGDEPSPAGQTARSDVYRYVDPAAGPVAAFARRLDRLILGLCRGAPALRGRSLVRGRPMAAVYAGAGARYAPHFDCVGGDNGRVLTCLLYLNPFWRPCDGAELRLYPEARTLRPAGRAVELSPLHGRLVSFLCDSRNLHEVRPVAPGGGAEPRLALSCWYYDAGAIPALAAAERTGDAPVG